MFLEFSRNTWCYGIYENKKNKNIYRFFIFFNNLAMLIHFDYWYFLLRIFQTFYLQNETFKEALTRFHKKIQWWEILIKNWIISDHDGKLHGRVSETNK